MDIGHWTLVAAAAVAALLYWLMGEEAGQAAREEAALPASEPGPGESETPPPEPRPLDAEARARPLRRLVFALLGGLIVVLLAGGRETGPREPKDAQGDPGRAFGSYMQGLLEVKQSFAFHSPAKKTSGGGGTLDPFSATPGETAEQVRARAIRRYQAAVRSAPTARLFRRQLGILLAFDGNLDAARAQFRRLAQVQRQLGDPRAESEARLWERILATPPPPPSAVPELRRQLDALRLGWFKHLALAILFRRTGQFNEASAAIRTATSEARSQLLLLLAPFLVMFLLALLGIFGGIAFVVLVAMRVVRPVPPHFRAGPAVLWEAFILYLLLYAAQPLVPFLVPALRTPTPQRSLAITIFTMLGSQAVGLVAVFYLAWALSRRRLSLAEVGLHARSLPANVAYGIGAYAVMLPWFVAVAVLTEQLGRRFFQDVAPPYHPIIALTAGSHEWWLRLALFAGASVAAPFFEELFFRGCLYGALRRRFGIAIGLLANAALFAALHPQLPLGFLPIFFLGAVFAAVYEWRQSLVPGMVYHAIHNGFLFLIMNLMFPPGS